jgi:hypothetical protein
MASRVEGIYNRAPGDPDFQYILEAFDFESDADLAELIEVDGRARLAMGRRVELQRYLSSIPGLHSYEMALDAAIDVALRQLSGGSRPTHTAVQLLCELHPHLAAAIEDAALLAEAVVSTTGVGRIVRKVPRRECPCDFGPTIESGERRYRLVQPLGSGSAGEVYLGEDRRLSESDRPALVAIKVLAAHGRGTRARQQLIDEASKARRVQHDNVVRVLDRGVSDEQEDYIVYEHIDAGTLDEWFEQRRHRISPREAAGVVAGIARGVQAAHAAGLMHCDLKPSNILLTASGTPKVADFGVAVRESEAAARGREASRPIGNIAFISPEQYLGREGSLSVASDVYALGGILYYLITASLPNGSTVEEVAATHDPARGRKAPPSPEGLDDRSDLKAICNRAMALNPADRHASAAALADDLQAWVDHQPIPWTKPSLWKIARLAAIRRPVLAVAAVVALLSLVGGSAAATYWASIAQLNEVEANKVRQRIGRGKVELGGFIDTLKRLNAGSFAQDLIPVSVVLDGLHGNAILSSEDREKLWEARIATARSIIEDYTQAGRQHGVETLLWEGILGLWLLNGDRFSEAEAVLVPSASKWGIVNLEGDPLAQQIRRLAACATVRRLAIDAKSRPLTPSELTTLREHEPVLQAGLVPGPRGGYPTRLHTLQALTALYDAALLNDPSKLGAAKKSLQRHLEGLEQQRKSPLRTRSDGRE